MRRNYNVQTLPAVRIVDPRGDVYYATNAAGEPFAPKASALRAALDELREGKLEVRPWAFAGSVSAAAHNGVLGRWLSWCLGRRRATTLRAAWRIWRGYG